MTCPDDYNVILLQMPGDILAAVRTDADGYPTIYINDALSEPARRQALNHELSHIVHDDLTNHLTIYDAERRAVRQSRINMFTRADGRLSILEEIRLARLGDSLHAYTFGAAQEWTPFVLEE